MSRITDPEESRVRPEAQSQNGKTILIVEDDPFISRMYQVKLTGAGFTVNSSTNGREAYELIKATKPDLVLMDINLPEMTGFEVVKSLRSDGEEALLKKVIILTNSANPDDRKLASEYGIDYVVKAELTPHDVLVQINKKLGL